MSKFDTVSYEKMISCFDQQELNKVYDQSCDICARRNLCRTCEGCNVKFTYDSLTAIFLDRELQNKR